jgi:hypothetical protein
MDGILGTVWGYGRWLVALAILGLAGYAIYWYFFMNDPTSSGDVASGQLIDGSNPTTIAANTLPKTNEGAYGIQFWLYVNNWDYKYAQFKEVLTRRDGTGQVNPLIGLHETDNKLVVRLSYLPAEPVAGASPQPELFECEVPNIPLQAWVAVQVTKWTRNVDVYLNGGLIKSCFVPGVPVETSADAVVAASGGFAGKLAGLQFFSRQLGPSDAQAFFAKGPPATDPKTAPAPAGLLGNVRLAIVNDATQQTLKSWTL